jgi:nucleoside-diphosphate-sugar epimerase
MSNYHERHVGIIGSNGFIGSNLLNEYIIDNNYNLVTIDSREHNIDTYNDRTFDCLYFCSGNSKVYLSNDNPRKCLEQSVLDLIDYLNLLKYNKFILLSSSVVYPNDIQNKLESMVININDLSPYGAHKLLAEYYVRKLASSHIIYRLTGVFGSGLKKNLLYDLKNKSNIFHVTPDSYIDFIEISCFAKTIKMLSHRLCNITLNIGSGFPISVKLLYNYAPKNYKITNPRFIEDRSINLSELHKHIKIYTDFETLQAEVISFLQAH